MMWQHTGSRRPPFAVAPEPGQESVWDYPRPPVIREDRRLVEVFAAEQRIANTERALRVCETASPPTYYLPMTDVLMEALLLVGERSFCEWKGQAVYYALVDSGNELPVAWTYPEPRPGFSRLKDTVGFFPGRLRCTVDGNRVSPQPGGFYAGWITPEIVGPFKGDAGTGHW